MMTRFAGVAQLIFTLMLQVEQSAFMNGQLDRT
jgi:hypothetical protein